MSLDIVQAVHEAVGQANRFWSRYLSEFLYGKGTQMSDEEMRANAMRDQAWADIAEYEAEVNALANEFSDSVEPTEALLGKCCCLISAEICYRRGEAEVRDNEASP